MNEKADVLRQLGWSEELINAFLDSDLDDDVRDQLAAQELGSGVSDSADVAVAGTKMTDGTHLVLTADQR